MTQLPSPEDPTLEDRKLALEVEKIQVEIAVLRNPYRHPQFWGAVLIAVVSMSVAVAQFARSNQDYVLAQIKSERLALEADRLELKRSTLEAASKALAHANEIRRTELASVETEFRGVAERLASTRLTRDQLNREVRLLREAVVRAKNATLRNQPAIASMTVVTQDGMPLRNGDTVFLGDRVIVMPILNPPTTTSPVTGWSPNFDFKTTPTPAGSASGKP